jgi:hypothetical protein
MGVLTMNMSGYEIERGETVETAYGEEVLCAGWVPALALRESQPECATVPPELAAADVDAFLRKMYAWQR